MLALFIILLVFYASQAGANKRENEIRWGSSLRVKDGEVAVFVYKQKNGTMAQILKQPMFRRKLILL